MATINIPQVNSRVPTQPQTTKLTNYMFPGDLIASNRNMYMVINLCNYQADSVLNGATLNPYTSIALPIPLKLNDQLTVDWEQASLTQVAASMASQIFGTALQGLSKNIYQQAERFVGQSSQVATAFSGKQINPFLVMLFKTQNFKEHVFQWVFAPNNQNDTDQLQNIIEYLKAAELPSIAAGFGGGALLNYPNVAQINFSVPNGQTSYLYQFKPCAITSVAIDWTAGPSPAFIKNGAPQLVSIVLQLKEIELWFNNGPGKYS